MEGKAIILLAALAVSFGEPVPVSQEPPALRPALASYAAWTERVSRAFSRDSITSRRVRLVERSGQVRHDALNAAIQTTAAKLNLDISAQNPSVKNKALQVLRNSVVATSTNPDRVLGLLSNPNEFEIHGAKLSVWTDLFKEVSGRFRGLVEDIKEDESEIDSEKLLKIFEVLYASEIAFDGLVSNFQSVEEKFDNAETDGSEIGRDGRTEDETADKNPILARRKRSTDLPIDLGGGFSTNLERVSWRRGGSSAFLKPHYNLGVPPVTGATLGASHNFGRTRVSGVLSGDYYGGVGGNLGASHNFERTTLSGALSGDSHGGVGASLGASHNLGRTTLSGALSAHNYGGVGASLGVKHRFNDRVSMSGSLSGGYNHNTGDSRFGVGVGLGIRF